MFKSLTNKWATGEDSKIAQRQASFIRLGVATQSSMLENADEGYWAVCVRVLRKAALSPLNFSLFKWCGFPEHGSSTISFHWPVFKRLLKCPIVGKSALLLPHSDLPPVELCFFPKLEAKSRSVRLFVAKYLKCFTTPPLQMKLPTTFSCPFGVFMYF